MKTLNKLELYNHCNDIISFVEKRVALSKKAYSKYNNYKPIQDRIFKNMPEIMHGFPIWNKKEMDFTGNYKQIFTAIKMSKGFGINVFYKLMNI